MRQARDIYFYGVLAMALTSVLGAGGGCDRSSQTGGDLPAPRAQAARAGESAEWGTTSEATAKGDQGTASTRPSADAAKSPTPRDPTDTGTAVFAGGCFWCVEAVFEQLDGVTDAVSGYAGGTPETANYTAVCTGLTGHAEVVKITYDPAKISYGELLRVFFSTHDPTTLNRQGPDSGPQYRSAIFYENDAQKQVAESYIQQLNEAKAFSRPIVTTLEKLEPGGFYVAEEYHQDYATCNPNHGYIQVHALPKVRKVREKFADRVRPLE